MPTSFWRTTESRISFFLPLTELLVQAEWVIPISDGTNLSCPKLLKQRLDPNVAWRARIVVLLGKVRGRWQGLAEVAFVLAGDHYCYYDWDVTAYVRLGNGRAALRGGRCDECADLGGRCETWVAAMKDGKLVELVGSRAKHP
jgi:hypothetical protein